MIASAGEDFPPHKIPVSPGRVYSARNAASGEDYTLGRVISSGFTSRSKSSALR